MSDIPEGSLRVWNIINPPNSGKFFPVSSPKEGYDLIEKLAAEQLKQDWIHSNAFGLEVFEDGEWEDWYNEDGMSLDEMFGGQE